MIEKVLLLGGSGFLGNELGIHLVQQGYEVHLLSRSSRAIPGLAYPAKHFTWDQDGSIPDAAAKGVSSIINLAGESIAEGRWTPEKKKRIVRSRVNATEQAVLSANKLNIPLYIGASAVGYYGDCGDRICTESDPAGDGFLADTAQKWEKPLDSLRSQTRKVCMRFGVILGTTGGAFMEMLTPYLMGTGAAVGSGKQFLSFIHIQDLCRFILSALREAKFSGTYNLTSPTPTTYQELHRELIKYFGGFSWLKVPSFVFKATLGEKSQLLLMSQRIIPERALEHEFDFRFPDIASCVSDLLRHEPHDAGIINYKQWLPMPRDKVWDFFSKETNLEEITPPWLNFRIVGKSTKGIEEGTLIHYKLKVHGLPIKWTSQIMNIAEGECFRDIQITGPYKTWDHSHTFKDLGDGTLMEDFVKFKMPLGLPGKIAGTPLARMDVEKIFHYRQNKIASLMNPGFSEKIV